MRIRKIVVEMTRSCNRGCRHCEIDAKPESDYILTVPTAEKIVDQIENSHVRLNVALTGGEPFLNPDFYEILKIFRNSRYVKLVSIITSGAESENEIEMLKRVLDDRSKKVAWCLSYNQYQKDFKKRIEQNLRLIIRSQAYGLKFNVSSAWDNRVDTIKELESIFKPLRIRPFSAIRVDHPQAVNIFTNPHIDPDLLKRVAYGTRVMYAHISKDKEYGIYIPLDYYPLKNSGRARNMEKICIDRKSCYPLFTNHIIDIFIDAGGNWRASWDCYSAKNFIIGNIDEKLRNVVKRGMKKLELVRKRLLSDLRFKEHNLCSLCKKVTAEVEAMSQ